VTAVDTVLWSAGPPSSAPGRFAVGRLAWVLGVLLGAAALMAWLAEHRPPHPGNPIAARLAALRGLWPASARAPLVVVGAVVLVLAVDALLIAVVATGRARRLTLRGGVGLGALALLAALQSLHQGEHVVQAIQLLVTNGNADLSQGVVTRLNQELVHLTWTSCVWLGCAALLCRFRRNRWLWLALAVASLHEVEHIYLFTVALHPAIALHGGMNGIFARGGLVGGPLQRPYMHFLYNLLELLPILAALIDETAAARPRRPRPRADIPAVVAGASSSASNRSGATIR
jgi:hypothetical protein